MIWSAYFSIPLVIIRYISKKQDIRFKRLYFLFAAFILACGSTHFLDAAAFWFPIYRLNALARLVTGILSWVTVFYLIKFLPAVFSVKSQKEFETEMERRGKGEGKIMQLNAELERRVSERTDELFKSEKKYRHLFESNPMPMWIIDLETFKFLDVNEAAISHYGYGREEFLAMTALDIRPEEEVGLFKRADHTRTINPANYNRGVWKHLKKDKTIIFAEVIAHDISFDGKTARFILSNDVTARIKAEEKLKESIKEITDYKYALEESSIVAITDQRGTITHANENFCKISRYSVDELIGRDHRIINSDYHPKEFIRGLWGTIAKGKIWRGELRNRARDGSIYWVDTTIVPFLDEQGKPYQYVAIKADITGRKEVEDELYKLNQELEDRVDLRTRQLEAANKEMEAFTYSVSHDLRTPLRGIIGFTTMLEEDYTSKLDDGARRITTIIKNNTLKMGRLIDDLLAFSRMGRQDIVKTGINTAEMVKEVISELASENNRSGIEWELETLPSIKGDINTIRQVWVNLISNAIKYSGKKERPHIGIGSFIHEGQIAFFIKDNGVGFDNKYKDKLFNVFQRLHGAEEFEGTGIGLALVMKIIAKHGGKVWAEAELDKGACFYFSLPPGQDMDLVCSHGSQL
ncbi:MAG TPA: PAS domain S-box protein [Puia sp.]|nr:PAS domain S-box protein [Puia sp.]